jgi:hypothetical protein
MFLLPLGLLGGADLSIADTIVKNFVPTTIGNAIAGAVVVAAVSYKVTSLYSYYGRDSSLYRNPYAVQSAYSIQAGLYGLFPSTAGRNFIAFIPPPGAASPSGSPRSEKWMRRLKASQ